VNSGIIGELKRSDFYVFIDFRRDKLWRHFKNLWQQAIYRGSLFTNQELAIAYLLQFDKAIFFQQEGIEHDGFSATWLLTPRALRRSRMCRP